MDEQDNLFVWDADTHAHTRAHTHHHHWPEQNVDTVDLPSVKGTPFEVAIDRQ